MFSLFESLIQKVRQVDAKPFRNSEKHPQGRPRLVVFDMGDGCPAHPDGVCIAMPHAATMTAETATAARSFFKGGISGDSVSWANDSALAQQGLTRNTDKAKEGSSHE